MAHGTSNRELAQMIGEEQEEEQEEVMTAKEVLDELQEAWANEKLSPELLPHKAELVEVMMEQIDQMEENVKALNAGDLRSVIHRHELERIRFLLGSYLRCRLAKLEKYSLYLLHNDKQHLSSQEHQFVRSFATHSLNHLKLVTDRIPGPLGHMNPSLLEAGPDLQSHIFVRAKVPGERVMVPDMVGSVEDEVSLDLGSQHILPYSSIRTLLHHSKVSLI